MSLVIRKLVVPTTASNEQMTADDGTVARIGPSGVPVAVHVNPVDPPSGGIDVEIRDQFGTIFAATGVAQDTPYDIDSSEMKTNGCAGPLFCDCSGEAEIVVLVKE